jgi:hypothetical protein
MIDLSLKRQIRTRRPHLVTLYSLQMRPLTSSTRRRSACALLR